MEANPSTQPLPPRCRPGFGSSRLRAGSERRNSHRLIEIALSHGVTHFDTAPSYGLGLSENILGEVLQPVRASITLTTKIGIPRPPASAQLTALRALVKPVAHYIPGVRSLALKGLHSLSRQGEFEACSVKASVEQSLARLRTDYIDYLLLHEPTAGGLSDELLFLLSQFQRQGLVKRIGSSTGGIYTEMVRHGTVGQFRYTPELACQLAGFDEIFLHGITKSSGILEKLAMADTEKLRHFSNLHDVDLLNTSNHVAFVIAAIGAATKSTPIYASSNPAHLENALAPELTLKNTHLLRGSLKILAD